MEVAQPGHGRGWPWVKKLALALILPAAFFGLLEAGLRLTGFNYKAREKIMWKPTVAPFDGTFEHYIQTYFDPPGYLWRSEANTAFTDAYGFRKPAISFRKQSGKMRIAFLGGSTTQGQRLAYPERAIRLINDALGTNRYEALNMACASYSTHQSLMAMKRWLFDRDPDLVCVYHGWNDLTFHNDSYTDSEKDPLFSAQERMGGWKQKLGARWRTLQWLARMLDALDVSWPRMRVPPGKFEDNLREMARLCAQQGKPLVIFTRPPMNPYAPRERLSCHRHLMKLYGSTNSVEVHKRLHVDCVDIQRRVAASEPNARLFDASAVVAGLAARREQGEFGSDAQIYQPDSSHLRSLGEQQLAQNLAMWLAPEHSNTISRYVNSTPYQMNVAIDLFADLMPREALYYLNQVLAREPDHVGAKELLARSRRETEFADLFWQGCWGGTDPVYESKIAKLKKCLAMRPDDFGVCTQIFRVCIYMERAGDAAAAMAGFQPANVSDQYGWLRYNLTSHVQAQRWPQAVECARLCLQINPNDHEARAFLQQAGAGG